MAVETDPLGDSAALCESVGSFHSIGSGACAGSGAGSGPSPSDSPRSATSEEGVIGDGDASRAFRNAVAGAPMNFETGFVDLSGVLNHNLDPMALFTVAQEVLAGLRDRDVIIKPVKPDAILTAPSSGNALAALFGLAGECPVVLAKSGVPASWEGGAEHVSASVPSRTAAGLVRNLAAQTRGLKGKSEVIVVDDVCGRGTTLKALLKMAQDAGSVCRHVVVFVEKRREGGRAALREAFPDVTLHAIAAVDL